MNYIIIFIVLFIVYVLYQNIMIINENFVNNLLENKYGHPYSYFKDENYN
jgi:hypothetical protein